MAVDPTHFSGPVRLSSDSAIWREAPTRAGEQGRMITMAPDLSNIIDGTPVAVRVNGANDAVFVGGYWAHLTCVDTGAADSEVFRSVGGRLVMTPDAADNDNLNLIFQGGGTIAAPVNERLPFLPVANSVIRFGIRAKVSDATQSDFLLGLSVSDADVLGATTDGIYFRKLDGDTQPDFVLEKNSSETVLAMTDSSSNAVVVEDDTYFEAGFVINGLTRVTAYWNGASNVQSTVTNLDDDEPLTIAIQIQNGAAAAKTLTIEKMVCTQTMV